MKNSLNSTLIKRFLELCDKTRRIECTNDLLFREEELQKFFSEDEVDSLLSNVNGLYGDYLVTLSTGVVLEGKEEKARVYGYHFKIEDLRLFKELLTEVGIDNAETSFVSKEVFVLENGLTLDSNTGILTYKKNPQDYATLRLNKNRGIFFLTLLQAAPKSVSSRDLAKKFKFKPNQETTDDIPHMKDYLINEIFKDKLGMDFLEASKVIQYNPSTAGYFIGFEVTKS